MKYLFTPIVDAKVKDTNLPDFHPGLQGNLSVEKLRPQFSPAAREYLIPYLGRPFYNVLTQAVEDITENAGLLEAIELARYAFVQYVMYETIPLMQGNLSNLGFQVMSDREGTSNSPRQWEYYNARRHAILKADKYLDQLLVFLDKNRDDPAFSTYDTDPAISYRRSRVFRQVAQLDEYWNIQGSRRAWNTVTPYLNKAEKRSLQPVVGATLFAALPGIADDPARTQVQGELLEHCRDYVAEVGLVATIPHLSCVIGGDSIVIVSRTDGFETKNSSGLINAQAAIARLQQDANIRATGALRDLQQFLADNADNIPEYTAPVVTETETVIDSPGAVGFF